MAADIVHRFIRTAAGCALLVVLLAGCGALPGGIVQLPTATATPHASPFSQSPAPILLAYGRFESLGPSVSGSVRLILNPDGSHVVVLGDFSTDATGDLRVVLSESPASAAMTAAPDGVHALSLGALKATSGNQTYEVPDGVSVDDWKSVVIWSSPDGPANGAADLNPRG